MNGNSSGLTPGPSPASGEGRRSLLHRACRGYHVLRTGATGGGGLGRRLNSYDERLILSEHTRGHLLCQTYTAKGVHPPFLERTPAKAYLYPYVWDEAFVSLHMPGMLTPRSETCRSRSSDTFADESTLGP
jgi:hypothetical protein